MKRSSTLAVLLASAALAQAQPVLTFPANAPTPGSSYTLHYSPYASPGTTGANHNWDLSMLTTDSTAVVQRVTPGSTAHGASFPGATVAETGTAANTYFRSASDGMYFVGSEADELIILNSDEGRYLPFPCTYQTSWTDQSAAEFSVEDFNDHRHSTITGIVDGYGSVAMPSGTVNNVLRIHWHEETIDSSDFFTFTTVNDSYIFYSAEQSYPLARLFTGTITFLGQTDTIQFSEWVDEITTGIPSADSGPSLLELYPVPTSDVLNFIVPEGLSGRLTINITDAQGKIVSALPQAQLSERGGRVDLNGLAPGIYHFSAMDEHGQRAERNFVKQ